MSQSMRGASMLSLAQRRDRSHLDTDLTGFVILPLTQLRAESPVPLLIVLAAQPFGVLAVLTALLGVVLAVLVAKLRVILTVCLAKLGVACAVFPPAGIVALTIATREPDGDDDCGHRNGGQSKPRNCRQRCPLKEVEPHESHERMLAGPRRRLL